MGHDAEFVQRGLSIEEDNVSINEMPFHHITEPQLLSHLLSISILQKPEWEKVKMILKYESHQSKKD